jgi:polyisoprenoid-binding protein YceI
MRRFTLAALALATFAPLSFAATPGLVADPVPQGKYEIDKLHTSLLFRVSHLGFSSFTGRFTSVNAKLDFDPRKIAASRVEVTVDPRSVQADNVPTEFLKTLSGKGWLGADQHPAITFRSRRVEMTGTETFRLHGDFTLNGVTKPLVLEARYNGGYASHPYEPSARIGFSAKGSLKRSDFGVSAGLPVGDSTFGVGNTVVIVLETEFTGPAYRAK